MGCEESEIIPIGNLNNMLESENSENNQIPRAQPQFQQQQYGGQNFCQPQPVRAAYPPPNYGQPPGDPPNQKGEFQPGKVPQSQHTVEAAKKHMMPREHLDHQVNFQDDFLAHHLRYQLSLTKLTSMKKIRRRQIFQHLWLQVYWGSMGRVKQLQINFQGYQESLASSWIQRTFLDIWEIAHDDLFNKHLQAKIVRRKVAQQFMFELYELKQYVDSGLASINFATEVTQCSLFDYVQASDDALFNLFKKLKEKYPQTSGTAQNIVFPDLPTTKTNANLLNHFQNLCFSDPDHMNYQTIYEDINFLLKKAIQQQTDFKNDMKDILGDDVLACPKVGQVNKEGKTSFNACAVRRVFVKWCQNLLEKCPDLQYTKTFMQFIKAKSKIVNNFFFKSTIQPTTHKVVLDCISLLLQLAKFGLKDKKQREQFIFNIYDLLRCKIKRNTPQQIVDLLEKMKNTKTTKSGKKFEVLRVKNRFKTNNRDLLINFRYGDVLVGEAQLGVDTSGVSKQAKLNYEFCHYIYELQRSLFGPTIELMMQYEDFQRPDITVDFEAKNLVPARKEQFISHAGPVQRKCLQGHDMISLKGNFFFPAQSKEETEDETIAREYPAICNYCDRQSTIQTPYDYCYHCGCYLCKKCSQDYQKVNTKQFWLSIMRQDLLPEVKNIKDLEKLCAKNKSLIVLFWLDKSSASEMYRDAIIYQQGKLMMQPGKYLPKIAAVKYSKSPEFNQLIKKYKLKAYPSLILLDQKAQSIRTIIGFSWFETPNIYMTQQRIIEGKGYDNLSLKCVACQSMVECLNAEILQGNNYGVQYDDDGALENYEGELKIFDCLNCFGTAKPVDAPKQFEKLQFACGQGHRRCLNCCYAVSDIPSTFKDFMGGQYLSSTFVDPKLKKCPKGHQTVLSRTDPNNAWEFTCFNCKQKRFFDNEHGVGQCTQCNQYLCSKCLGANRPTFNEINTRNKPNLVRHYVQSTAEQAVLCICQRHFKKAYCGRILTIEQLNQQNEKGWKCFLCQSQGKNGQLHLACFACPKMTEAFGQKYNFQICMRCATKSNMMMREPPKKIEEIPSLFSCPKDNKKMVQTTFAYKKRLVVTCHYCKQKYFGNTERYYCTSCDLNCCMNCREKLWRGNPPRCPQKCYNGHELKFEFVKPNSLQYCDGCMTVMKDEAFKCADDDYVLCSNCVKMNPPNFVGTVLQNLRNMNQMGNQTPQLWDEEEEESEFDIDRPFGGYDEEPFDDDW